MKQNKMNIVIAVNRFYLRYSYIMLSSLLKNNDYPMDVYVIHRDLLSDDETFFHELEITYPVEFHFLHVTNELLPPQEFLVSNSYGIETYFRLMMFDLLPESVERAAYIDSDIIINQSIADFYFCDLGNNRMAGCKDFISQPPFGDYRDDLFKSHIASGYSYFNAGFTLYDVKKLKTDYNFQKYMCIAKDLNYQMQFPDQDLLNYCHQHETLLFDGFRFNLYARRAYTDHGMRFDTVKEQTAVIHYASSKPWHGNCLHCDIEQLWWDYAKDTPFYHELLEETMKQTMTDSTLYRYVCELEAERSQLYHIINQYETLLKKIEHAAK